MTPASYHLPNVFVKNCKPYPVQSCFMGLLNLLNLQHLLLYQMSDVWMVDNQVLGFSLLNKLLYSTTLPCHRDTVPQLQ